MTNDKEEARATTGATTYFGCNLARKPGPAVAHDLGISPRTVEVYRANLMTKMRPTVFPTSFAWC